MKKSLKTGIVLASAALLSASVAALSACDAISGLFGGSVSSLEKFMDSADSTFTNYTLVGNYSGTQTYTREGQFIIGSGSGTDAYSGKLIEYYGTSKYTSSTVWILDGGYLTTRKYSYDAVKSSETVAYDITTDSSSDIYVLYKWSNVNNFISLDNEDCDYSVKKTTEDSTVTYTVEVTWESDSGSSNSVTVYTLVYTEGDDGTYAITSATQQYTLYISTVRGTTAASSYTITLEATDAEMTHSFS